MATDNYFKTINSAALIEEIKLHPELYDPKVANGNPDLKRRAWEAVAEALLEKQWAMFAEQEQEAIIRELQVKWKSLRDNFTRVLRKEKEDEQLGIIQKNKKKYIYFEQLKFLTPHTSFRKRIDNIIYLDENKESDSFQYSNEENPLQSSSQGTSMQPLQFIQIQPRPALQMSNVTITDEEDNGGSANKKIAAVLEEVVAIQKEEKADDPMGNKKFLLSLLPFMKKLPDDVNLEVRLQLMSVLQTYTNGKSLLQ